ncbi:MAG: rhodanese-like domain-containing protein [Campylobacterales bacterium]|nr:rhodanese-like domain-containing protein [Campylobacterales bacterium]
MKSYLWFLIVPTIQLIGDSIGFEYEGVSVKNGKKQFVVKRYIPDECAKLPIVNEIVWTGNYADPKVPDGCKSTYVHTTGHLQPMKLDVDVETYGELEVLAFIKEMQEDDHLMLIDGRKEEWFEYLTIPGAVNIPFEYIKYRDHFVFEFENAMKKLGVKIKDEDIYDFSNAKTIVVFCNGPWCSQSVSMVKALIEIGYPHDKIKWYRGGLQHWLGAGMTGTRN